MNVYDKAHELAKALKETAEYQEMQQAMKELSNTPDAQKVLDDFRGRQMYLQTQMMTGKQPSDEEMSQMEKLYEVLNMNPQISRLFEAERRLSVIIQDLNKIITGPVEDMYKK